MKKAQERCVFFLSPYNQTRTPLLVASAKHTFQTLCHKARIQRLGKELDHEK